ncbi:MAG TPA: Rib/alpha-like domain-containing protein [Clostridia bacterium]|nr:Rib/alpha-like domain-containing protein [Clostridia bacterium]
MKYRRQLEDGTNTDIAVPGINDITGSLPLGEHDFDQLQVIGKFAPVAGQNTKKEIKTEGNVFTFYYVDDAPVFSGCDNVVIEYGAPFNLREGITVTDDEDGDLTASFTVTPDSINTSNPVVYNLEYKVIDSGGNVVTKQRTVTIKPQAPYNMTAINDRQAHETTTVITGKADKGAEISVTIGAKTWGTVVDNNGNFTLNIDKQNKGEIITVTSKLNNQTTSANVTVQNVLADDYLPTVADIDREYGVATNEAEIKAAVTIPNYPVGEAQPIVTVDEGQTIPDGNTSGDHPINVTVTYSDGSTNKVVVTVSVYYQYTINNRIRLENGNNTAKPVPDKPQEVGSLPLGAHNFQLQAIGQYAPAANQITDVTIQTEGNVFTFYYIDEAPVFTEFEDIYVGYNDAFNPKTGIKAIDDEEGEIEYTVTPAAIDTSVPDEYILTYRAEDSSGNVTVKTRKITVLPQPVYDYTIYFLIQLENGNKTDKAVPNKLPKTGQLPEGPYSFGQLQPIGKYAPVPNQVTDVTIQTEGNVFTFYYIDEAPVFTGCEDIIIEYGTPFNPRAGVAVTDDEEGEVEYTVTPEVNVNQPSDYVLTYRAEDSSGNVTVKARTVTVLPRAPYDLTAINNRQLHPTTTVITGKANPGAVISVEIAPKTWAVQVGAQGNFTLSIDKQLKDTVIEVKATLNNHIKSANVIVQNVQADDYLPTVADIVKQYGVPATQAEVTNAVTVPNYPAGQQQPAVTVDAGQTIPDGNTSGDYPINVTVTYPDGSANAATVKVSVLYRYKVNYRIRLEDGSNTNKQVPGINDITGSLPLGAHDFGQLQVVGQYTPAANQNTDVTIQTEGNVFTFYYIDDAPVFTGCDNVVIEHGIPFNPRAGVTVADDEDGDLTDSFTVQPANIDTTDPKIYVLEYKVTDSGGNVVTKQRTVTIKPQAPYNMTAINDSKAHETTTVITGKADKGAEISVTIGNDTWNTVVDNNGNFTLNIDKQNKGVVLEVKATLNNHTKSANVIVQNVQADDYEPTVIDIFKKFGVATTEAEVKAAVAVENYPAGQLQPAVTVNLAELPDGLTSGDNQVSVTVTYPDGTKDDVKVTVKVNYRYKVNYFIRLANGDNTTKPVPNILPKTGDLPVGQHELGPLPDGGAYAKVENQGTLVTIDGTTDNVFNFYYVDDAPVFNDFDDVILMYGALINPKMDVTAIDDEDGEIDFTVAPKIDTTVPGIYTVTYRAEDSGGNVTEKTRKVTVNQAQNVTYEPVVVPEIVEYNGVVNLKDNVTNLQQLPEGTMILDTTHPAIDTTVPGKHTGQITVIYRDGTSDVFNVDVTVQPQPMNQIYEPDVFPEIVEYGEVINLLDNIANADTFPDNTDISDTTDPVIDTTVPGVYKGQITVTYPDGTKDVVNVKVTVNPQPDIPDNQVYNPNVVDEVVEYDGVIDLTDNVLNFENLPDGTQVADTTAQPIDTKVPGTYPGQLTITYPDQTTDVYNIQVTVKTQPHNEKYVPVVIPEIVEYGDVINLKDNVTNADTFPLNTVISDTTDPVIDSTVPGLYRGEITVTYPDGTKNVVNVQVTVKHKPDIPDNQSYNPVVVDETVPYGGVIDLTDNVTNLDNLPDQTTVTDTTAQPIDTRLPGTYAGEITITYPDQTTTVINVQVTVQPQPLNEKFEPVVVPEIVEYSGVINLKDNVTNADELPLNTVIADTTVPPINTRLPGVYTGQITVTYPDQTTDVVDVQVRVQPEPDYLADEEVNAPVVIDEIVAYGGVIDLTDNVLNLKDLPAGTRVMEIYKQEIDTTVPGTYRGQLAVIYPDASVIVSDVRIIVKEQTQSDTHNPVVRDDETVGYGEDIDWKDVIDNIDDLPPGTTVTETSENPIDTTVPGTHQGQVTVTYPDGSQEVIDVTVTVEEQPQSDIHNPVVRDDETVGYGEDIDWKDVIDNIDDLPPGTTVTETSENPIDTTVPGTHQGQVTVTYPDGSQEVIDVTVTVEEQPQSDTHNPVVRDDEIVGYGEEIDWRDVIDNIDDLPPGTTVTETSENPIDTTVPGTHQGQVTVTYPDGSQEVIDVTVTVEEQPQSDRYNPVIGSETVEYGKEIEWKDVVENMEDLPEGTTVTDTSAQPLDTTVPGTYIREITITYPDGSTEVMEVEVTVKEDSGQAPSPTPGPDTEEETPEEVKEESWSLVSVISTVFSALAMLIQFLIKSVKVDDSGAHFVRNKIFKLITAVLAVVAIVYLFSTNNLSLTMRMVNETTPVSAIMTVATTTSLILGMRWKPSKK